MFELFNLFNLFEVFLQGQLMSCVEQKRSRLNEPGGTGFAISRGERSGRTIRTT